MPSRIHETIRFYKYIGETMKNEYFKKAKDFFTRGKKEYEYGFKANDTLKIREGCEKIFHSLIELSNGIIAERGMPLPKNPLERSDLLA